MPARPACAEHTGHAVERVDLQTGVVCDGGDAGRGVGVAGLGQRVLLERRPSLGRLVERRNVIERQQGQFGHARGVEHAAQLGQLLMVAAGDQQTRHRGQLPKGFFAGSADDGS
ncbi:acyltransferase [Mycolicibacterium vaccae 95051]|nr:acyltransferase [Mycolicibacterium vaccae 95051]